MNVIVNILQGDLKKKKCVPCEGGIKPLTSGQYIDFLERYLKDWKVVRSKVLEKEYKFKDFKSALDFVNKVGVVAESEGHHPDILMYGWNKVRISLTTHAINGLSENDFILASKIDG
jgi:4a-hydroxytetrahydrobiopterin dehydratase